ncbi:MAG: radical SAM family heme chaperone HemW [Planctomycetota bacterium]
MRSVPETGGDPRPGLYIHIPFCVRRCRYCAFYSTLCGTHDPGAYVRAVLAELDPWAGPPPATIYLGGGTPTALPRSALRALVGGLNDRGLVTPEAEFTVETNPGTLDGLTADLLLAAGVNRLSIGCQSFDDATLRFLGRIHSGADGAVAVRLARAAGFPVISLDLLRGVPGRTAADAHWDLERTLELVPDHISCYELAIEEGTPLDLDRAAGRLPALPDEAMLLALDAAVHGTLEAAGYRHYEVANFARPGRECRHNLLYWRGADHAAAGAGAVSLENGVRRRRVPDVAAYVARIAAGADPADEREQVTGATLARERFLMGLRLREGIDADDFLRQTGTALDVYLPRLRELED